MNSLSDMGVQAPVGVVCASGKPRESYSRCGGPSWPRSMTDSNSAGTNASWMGASRQRKRGYQSRTDQARQGHKVNGIGRWCGYSAGSIPGVGVPSRSQALTAALDTVAVTWPHQPGCPRKRPDRLIVDRADDSNAARALLVRRGIEPIILAWVNNQRVTHQDGRRLRRYRRCWIVERTIGWLGNFRRLTVRYDRLMDTYGGFFHLACALITLRKVLK